jgi:hypothetical protein
MKIKTRNSVPNHFAEDKKGQKSVPNHFAEEKNTQNYIILFRTFPRKIKILGLPFWTISQKRKTLRILFQTIKRKIFWNLRWCLHDAFYDLWNWSPAKGRGIDSRNRVWKWVAKQHRLAGRYDNPMPTWFLALIAGQKLPTQNSFVSNLRMGYSEKHGIPQNEHFFLLNNENCSESIPQNFFGTEFWLQPCLNKRCNVRNLQTATHHVHGRYTYGKRGGELDFSLCNIFSLLSPIG